MCTVWLPIRAQSIQQGRPPLFIPMFIYVLDLLKGHKGHRVGHPLCNWTQHIIILISTAIKCSHSASDQTNCSNQTFHYISRAAIVGPLRHSIILCPPSALPLLKCDLANRAEHTILVLHMEFVCTVNHWPHIQTWSQGKYLSTQKDCKQVCGSKHTVPKTCI